jgi:hypothetical protein
MAKRRLTQHKRSVPYGTHPNPSLTLRTSFMLKTLYAIVSKRLKIETKKETCLNRIEREMHSRS